MSFDVQAVRRQFPLLTHHPEIAYLDGAATTHKPDAVLAAMQAFYEHDNANVHRSFGALSQRATDAYEGAREMVRSFLSARFPDEIVFTRGTTEAINLVARSYGEHLTAEDAVIVTRLDHHSNIIPWLQLRTERGVEIHWLDVDDDGHLRMDQYADLLQGGCVKLVAVTGQSNVLGTRPDLRRIIDMAHEAGAVVLVDGAQFTAHDQPDVAAMGCDFFAFSGHKTYGPTGVGVLYGKRELLREMPPFLGGGMMLRDVTDDGFTPADPPARFEAGTPPVAEAIGLAAALTWLQAFPPHERRQHEETLLARLLADLRSVPGLRILGPADIAHIHGCASFVLDGVHAHDVAEMLGGEGICVRAGHHCAQPLHKRLGIAASTRVSLSIHTTEEEIACVAPALERVIKKMR